MKKIYLAIPYTGMLESSYEQANLATIKIMNMGHNPFSPITHSHPLTTQENNNLPHTWEFWEKIDCQFIKDFADEVWVCVPKEGFGKVLNSTGVQAEIEYAKKLGKPIKIFQDSSPLAFDEPLDLYDYDKYLKEMRWDKIGKMI